MDRTKIKDQFGQFGRRREYGADDDRTTSRQMKNQGGCAPQLRYYLHSLRRLL